MAEIGHVISVEINGQRYPIRSTLDQEYVTRLAIYVDRFGDVNSDAAKSALTAMKTFKWKNQTPFAQAVFEEAQPK